MPSVKTILLVVLFALAPGTAVWAQTKISPAVEQQIAKNSTTRVIILTRPDPAIPGGGTPMSSPQTYLRSALGPAVNRIGTLPAASAIIDAVGLERLRHDPNVAKVVADIPVPPALVTSVPFIGADVLYQRGVTGSGLTVAVLDTGVDATHPALAGAIKAQACFSTMSTSVATAKSLCPNGLDVSLLPNAAQGCPPAVDGCEHGTHVAGIVAGRHMSIPQHNDFHGVAPGAGVVAVQVFTEISDADLCSGQAPCVLSYPSDQLRALEWVLKNQAALKIAAVNMSLGGGYRDDFCDSDSALTESIERLFAKGVATVIAAGNDRYYDGVSEPGCISAAVTVAAVGRDGLLDVAYSNMGKQVDLAAPGTGIISSVPGGGYRALSGTSMATPHVAAAWALLRQEHPDESGPQLLQRLIANGSQINDPRTGAKLASLHLAAPPAVVAAPAHVTVAPVTELSAALVDSMKRTNLPAQSYIVRFTNVADSVQAAVDRNCKQLVCSIKKIGEADYRLDVKPDASAATAKEHAEKITALTDSLKATQGVKVFDNTPNLALSKQ
jgi:subtilisin family serine protease